MKFFCEQGVIVIGGVDKWPFLLSMKKKWKSKLEKLREKFARMEIMEASLRRVRFISLKTEKNMS